jgi:Bacterial Ig-like domain (group 2)
VGNPDYKLQALIFMKSTLYGLSVAIVLLLGILTASAQTNIYLFTGSETNITLPAGTYIITAYGAQGGVGYEEIGGLGTEMSGEFSYSTTTTLTLLVGGGGNSGNAYAGGGGGGSFVVNSSTPLVIAGGGGGGGEENNSYGGGSGGGSGLTGTTGGNGYNGADGEGGGGGGGSSGGGGGAGAGDDGFVGGGGGGGGYSAAGSNAVGYPGTGGGGGQSFIGGGGGGGGGYNAGGYGGGGEGISGGGGGGGYSGGGGGGIFLSGGGGGGGGSIIDSSASAVLTEVSGVASPDGSPNGEIIITEVSTLTNIVISPASVIIVAGSNAVFAATGYFSDGSVSGLASTNGLVWSSSNPGVATINTNGVARGLTSGLTTITATDGSVSNNATLTVLIPSTAQTNQFLYTGVETNIALNPGIYIITTYGAQGIVGVDGAIGGLGAEMRGEFSFSTTTTLTILVGGSGSNPNGYAGGGGGGSYVVNGSTPLVIAGGGGGGGILGDNGGPGLTGTNGGVSDLSGGGSGGIGGGGGSVGSGDNGGGGGGGYSGAGSGGVGSNPGGQSFISGGGAGTGYGGGGYGGGGQGISGAGGGGGYSGGGGGDGYPGNGGGGGGGGSIMDSSAITNLAEVSGVASPDDSPNGEIIITVVPAPPAVSIARVSSLPVALWPASATNYVLQMTTNLTTGNWMTVTSGIPFVGLQITNAPGTGFFLSTAQTSTALGIAAVNNLPVVVWPAATVNFVLQMSTNLTFGNWVTVTNGIPFSGLQITNAPGTTYFRLQ